jgi:hypothetical protein
MFATGGLNERLDWGSGSVAANVHYWVAATAKVPGSSRHNADIRPVI